MNFSGIINNAFRIAWRYKSLWVFGLFAGGGFGSFNIPDSVTDKHDFDLGDIGIEGLGDLDFMLGESLILSLILLGLVLFIAFLVASIISEPALVDGVNRIQRGGKYGFGTSLSTGIDFFWRMLGLTVLFIIFVIALIGSVTLVEIVLFKTSTLLGFLSLLPVIPLLIIIMFTAGTVAALATRSIVIRNSGVFDGLEEGWLLLRRNVGNCILIALIHLGISIGLFIVLLVIWGLVGLPIAAVALAAGFDLLPSIILVIVLGLPFSIVFGGFAGTVEFNLYTLFYIELVEPRPQVQPAAPPPPAQPDV